MALARYVARTKYRIIFRESTYTWSNLQLVYIIWVIIGSDRRPETKQGIEGKIVRFRSGRVRDRVRVRDN